MVDRYSFVDATRLLFFPRASSLQTTAGRLDNMDELTVTYSLRSAVALCIMIDCGPRAEKRNGNLPPTGGASGGCTFQRCRQHDPVKVIAPPGLVPSRYLSKQPSNNAAAVELYL